MFKNDRENVIPVWKTYAAWGKTSSLLRNVCAASECIAGPSMMTAGYMEAEKRVGIAHYLPSCQGFWLYATKLLAAVLAALLSARAVPGAASLATVPRGTRHKGDSGDLQGAVPGTLARSYRQAHFPVPRAGSRAAGDLPWACRCAPAAGDPLWGHKANPELGVYGKQASIVLNSRVLSPPANPYRLWHACRVQETARKTIAEAQPLLTPPHAKGLSTGPRAPAGAEQPGGLTYLHLPDDVPICRISNAVRKHNTLHNFHKHMQYIKGYTKSTFAGSPRSCQTPCVGAEPVLAAGVPGSTAALAGPRQVAAQETHCTGCAAKPPYQQRLPYALSLNLQLCFCLTSDPNSDTGIRFMFYMINTYFTEHLCGRLGSPAHWFSGMCRQKFWKEPPHRPGGNLQVNSNVTCVTAVRGAGPRTIQPSVPLQ